MSTFRVAGMKTTAYEKNCMRFFIQKMLHVKVTEAKCDVPRWIDGEKELPVLSSGWAVFGGEQVERDGVGLEVLEQRDGLVGAVRTRSDRHGGQLVERRQTLERVAEDRHEVAFEVADLTAHRRRVWKLLRCDRCKRTSTSATSLPTRLQWLTEVVKIIKYNVVTDHFSGLDRALGRVCVCPDNSFRNKWHLT